MPMNPIRPEPLKGAVRHDRPPARLLGDDEVERLIALSAEEDEDDEGDDK